ncbi:MAG: MucB/RseB C-terminal domain-containing protein [Burkholderiaceae bacterium]|nr:MucB/RseB C-terminal domain-containing protein [Burkholderiaceae bacterium]
MALAALAAQTQAWASDGSGAAAPLGSAQVPLPTDVAGWIARVQRAALERSYVGTFVVTTDAGATTGSRIWHAREGDRHMERIEALDGPARTIFRRNGEMRTFFHASRTVVTEPLQRALPFPGAVPALAAGLDRWYRAERLGRQRVAGLDADVVWLRPRDALRFGYRIWSEQGSGLVLRLQTVQADGHVREQASFLQVDLGTPVSLPALAREMEDTRGYRALAQLAPRELPPEEVAWTLREAVPGFSYQGCRASGTRGEAVQCTYADGLASVSLFFETRDGAVPAQTLARWSAGATQALARPLDAQTWLTVVGEVPAATLALFAERLVRVRK